MPDLVVINASNVLTDAEASAVIPALQKWDDTMVAPQWGFDPCRYSFDTWANFRTAATDPNVWPIFLNRHSVDPGVGGFHDDQTGRIYGRVFVGDCLRYGISWTVDLSHEAAELRGDPTIDQVVTLPDGRIALKELADPVEDDLLAIEVDGVKLSDFVLPSYFTGGPGPWDYGRHLTGPCPTLTAGGYQSLLINNQWTQVTAMMIGGPASYRSTRFHHGERMRKLSAIDPATLVPAVP